MARVALVPAYLASCVAALLLGAYAYANAHDFHDTAIGDLAYSGVAVIVVLLLPILTVAAIRRWWSLSIALVPLLVLWYLHAATDYRYPY